MNGREKTISAGLRCGNTKGRSLTAPCILYCLFFVKLTQAVACLFKRHAL